MKQRLLSTMVLLSLCACAPEPQTPPPESIRFEFGPSGSDVDLDLSKVSQKTKPGKNLWPASAQLTAQQKLEFVENTLALGQAFQFSDLKDSAINSLRSFRQTYQPQSMTFESSPYVEAIVGTSQKEAEQQVAEAQKFLPEDEKKLTDFLLASEKTYPWPKSSATNLVTSAQSLKVAEDYLQFVLKQLPSLNLNPLVLGTLNTEIPIRATASFRQVREELAKIQVAKNAPLMIDQIQSMIKTLEFPISPENISLLKQGKSLASNNLAAKDEQDVLSVVIQIWRLLTPEDRKNLIGSESVDLYNFLKDASASRLACLETRGCKRDLIVWIGKKTKIIPQIRDRGVSNLKEKINSSMMSYILARLDEEVLASVVTLPQQIVAQISEAMKEKLAEIAGIQKDFPGYVKKVAESWSSRKLSASGGRVLGLEQLSSDSAESTSALLGQSLMIKTRVLNTESAKLDSEEQIQWSVEHLNKLLALGGYKKNEQTSIRAMAQPIDIHFGDLKLTLQEILGSQYSFAVPDQVSLTSPYASALTKPGNFNVSVLGQSRLLRGFSESIQFLKDWQPTSFDPILGNETLSGAFSSAPSSLGDRKLFPKETLFALSVGNAAIILKNLLKDLTPVFVVAQESQIIWVNNFDIATADAVSMAGVVNLIAGRRDLKVSSSDLSEYMVAMGDFVRAIQGVQNSKSPYLLSVGASGKRNVEELLVAQQEVKILMVGLGNFLSNRMVAGDGWVHETYALKTAKIEEGEVKVMTQLKAIESLLQAYEITKLTPYLWSATDLYYKLNREKFNAETGFYDEINTLEQGTQAVKILKELQTLLPEGSQAQLDRLLRSWAHLIQLRLAKSST